MTPLLNSPAVLKHSCPPHRAETEDRSTCTFCARANPGMKSNVNSKAATGKSNTNEAPPRIVMLLSSRLARRCKSRIIELSIR